MMYLARINDHQLPRVKLVLVLGTIVFYLLVLLPGYAVTSSGAATLSTLLVIAIIWFFGLRIGLFAALLAFLINTLAHDFSGEQVLNEIIQESGLGLLALVLMCLMAWRLSDLEKKLEHEIAKRKQVEELLRRTQQQAVSHELQMTVEKEKLKLLEQVVSDISHDLKAPLSVISASIYLLEKLKDPEKQKKKLEAIKMQALVLERLIQDILTSAKLDRLHQLTFKPLDFNRLILSIGKGFAPKAEAKNITVTLDLYSGDLIILANENTLYRALVNLVDNALNYTPDGGNIVIRSYIEGSHAVTEIRDTGMGIATSELPHIFNRFYRADRARATQNGGTGLGLAITKRAIELHGGSIEVESVYGEGTVFRALLPRMTEKRLPLDYELAPIERRKKEELGGLNWGTENKVIVPSS